MTDADILGLAVIVIGAVLAIVLALSLCVAASRSDEDSARMAREREEQGKR